MGQIRGDRDGSCWVSPQPRTGSTKPEFLGGTILLQQVKFTDRPCLDELLLNLANLFPVRYELLPSEDAVREADDLLQSLEPKDRKIMESLSSHDESWLSEPRSYYQVLRYSSL